MGNHRKPKDGDPKHAKPKESKTKKVVAAGVVTAAVPAAGLVFATSAHAAPRIAPAGGDVTATCPDYTVKGGDTLSGIALAHGTTLAALKPLNPGIIAGARPDDYSVLYAGGRVHLPCSTPPPVKRHVYYRDCASAPAHLHRGDPGYRHALDMDGDGIACEGPWPPRVTPPPNTPPPVVGGSTVPVLAPDCPGTASGYCPHIVVYWTPLVHQAMDLVGMSHSKTSAVLSLMAAESSGNPNAINLTDSNAQAGHPSKGLMQVIQSTFNANHVAGTSQNLYDPLANIAAALNYINHQYGGNIPSSPY